MSLFDDPYEKIRECTCPPGERPDPCPRLFALSECQEAALMRSRAGLDRLSAEAKAQAPIRAKMPPNLATAIEFLNHVQAVLRQKNRRYGNSALAPVRVFSQASPSEQILVRLDDKLSRWRSGQTDDPEAGLELLIDLAGYLALLVAAKYPEELTEARRENEDT